MYTIYVCNISLQGGCINITPHGLEREGEREGERHAVPVVTLFTLQSLINITCTCIYSTTLIKQTWD